MKKTALLAVALATCLGYAPARAADVVSSNIVGYNKIALPKGYTMIGVQFTQVGGEDHDLATGGVLDKTMAGPDEEGKFATEMLVWNGNGYDTYGWSGTAGTDALEDESLNYKWLNLDAELAVGDFPLASGAWINAGEVGNVTISGEVTPGTTQTIQLVKGFNMVANPFPVTTPIATFGVLNAEMEGPDEEGKFATELLVWNGNGYDTYGWSGTAGTDALEDENLNYKWLNLDAELAVGNVDIGHAVWINAKTAGTITFTK